MPTGIRPKSGLEEPCERPEVASPYPRTRTQTRIGSYESTTGDRSEPTLRIPPPRGNRPHSTGWQLIRLNIVLFHLLLSYQIPPASSSGAQPLRCRQTGFRRFCVYKTRIIRLAIPCSEKKKQRPLISLALGADEENGERTDNKRNKQHPCISFFTVRGAVAAGGSMPRRRIVVYAVANAGCW